MKFLKLKIISAAVWWLFLASQSIAQENPPFWKDIQNFKKQDSLDFPKQNSILFIGSSSFRMWNDVQSAFPKHRIINRGFGGSKLPQVEMYADDIIFPYRPKQIVIYCGENDLATSGINADSVFFRFKRLYQTIKDQLPRTRILYVSIKPSPRRQHLMTEMIRANQLIELFLNTDKKAEFVDVFPMMLNENGGPRTDIFLDDNLHMNSTGYEIWTKAIKPHLVKTK